MVINREEALEEAYNQLDALDTYFGNGDTDKLIGVDLNEASVRCEDEIHWVDAIEVDDDDDEV